MYKNALYAKGSISYQWEHWFIWQIILEKFSDHLEKKIINLSFFYLTYLHTQTHAHTQILYRPK